MAKKNTMMIYGILKDGNTFDMSPISSKELIKKICTDDFAIPLANLVLDTQTENGERVRIVIPFNDEKKSYAIIGTT